jgi:hypothetical protein
MGNYLGIIIEQSLRDPAITKEFSVVARRRVQSWVFLLASVPADAFERHVKLIQSNMVTDDQWYAHYFRADELVVVYRDAVFHVSTDPASWGPAVEYGLAAGIPNEQLDFHPRTLPEAERFFGTIHI